MTKAFSAGLGRHVKLGVAALKRPTAPRFTRFLLSMAVPEPPPVVDYATKAGASLSRMYLNDRYGCCVISGKAHKLGVASTYDGSPTLLASDQEILTEYKRLKAGPGDSGCIITDVLDAMVRGGLLMGGAYQKIDGYATVDNTNLLELKVALFLFGGLTIGINLPADWLNAPNGGVWDATSSRIVGGHDVELVGYGPAGFVVSTWGGLRTLTYRAAQSQAWLTEVYATLAPAWYGQDKVQAATRFDYAKMAGDLKVLQSGGIPDVGPVSPPPPPPPPPSPPPPPPPAPDFAFSGTLTFKAGFLQKVTAAGSDPGDLPADPEPHFRLPSVTELACASAPAGFGWVDLHDWAVKILDRADELYRQYGEPFGAVLSAARAFFDDPSWATGQALYDALRAFEPKLPASAHPAGFGPTDILVWAQAISALIDLLKEMRKPKAA